MQADPSVSPLSGDGERCVVCGAVRAVGIFKADVPDELVSPMGDAVGAAVAEATGVFYATEPGGVRNNGLFSEHPPCDVLTRARRMVAHRFGVRMDDEVPA